jgi:hypothetical protein
VARAAISRTPRTAAEVFGFSSTTRTGIRRARWKYPRIP